MEKRDLLLLLGGLIIIGILWMAPEESTTRVPKDETHQRMYDVFHKEGKKAAGVLCEECHHKDGVPFPPEHPPKSRCLFCHKLQL
jgi:hypothetical protein